MNSPSDKSNPHPVSRVMLTWLICLAAAIALVAASNLSLPASGRPALWAQSVCVIILSIIFLGLWRFARWCCCWQNFRRTLLGAAILATLVVIFYTEEDWRGKRAWENCKADLEAKGVTFNSDVIHSPVCRMRVIQDSEGNSILLHQLKNKN